MSLAPFIPAWPDLAPFVAELWLAATAVAVLLVAFVVRKPNTAAGTYALVGLAAAFVSLLVVRPTDAAGRFAPMLAADGVALLWKLVLLAFTAGVVLLWFATTRHDTRQGDGPEFFLLLLCATLGMALMGSAANLLMVFLAVELASLPSYVLAGFRKTRRAGAEAALKYVLFGAAATSVMVWGLSLVYGLCGTLNLYGMAAADGSHLPGVAEQVAAQPHGSALLVVALLAVLAGVGFKIAAVPFHLWCPDVFEGAAVDVTTFLSVASKGAGLVLLLRLVTALADAAHYAPTTVTTTLAAVVGVMGAVTATVGNTAAYVQTNLKRLLAYSSIAHAGYMLCAVALIVRPAAAGAAGTAGTIAFDPAAGGRVLLYYLVVYLFMNLGAFAVVAAVARMPGGGETLDRYAGLGRRSPGLAAAFALCLFSLIGVPPLAGFTAKLFLMLALAAHGGWWWVLVAAVAVNTLLSVYYYARLLKAMYLDDGPPDGLSADEHTAKAHKHGPHPVAARPARHGLAGGLAVASATMLVVLFVGSNALSRLAADVAKLRPVGPPPAGAAPAVTAAR
jgi:NADH-quinone oxidoreductase subunit N